MEFKVGDKVRKLEGKGHTFFEAARHLIVTRVDCEEPRYQCHPEDEPAYRLWMHSDWLAPIEAPPADRETQPEPKAHATWGQITTENTFLSAREQMGFEFAKAMLSNPSMVLKLDCAEIVSVADNMAKDLLERWELKGGV